MFFYHVGTAANGKIENKTSAQFLKGFSINMSLVLLFETNLKTKFGQL
jgi:hypothetical protein